MGSGFTVGVDVGGTFTDVVALDHATGEIRVTKHPTQTGDPASGVVAAVGAIGWPLERADLLIHGTTITTNAVLERRLPRTGLITTRGFRDVLELGRRTRPMPTGSRAASCRSSRATFALKCPSASRRTVRS